MPRTAAAMSSLTASTALVTPLPRIAFLVAIAQFPGFVLAGGSPAGHGGAAVHAAFEVDFHLNGGIAARVEDFQGTDVGDGREVGHR